MPKAITMATFKRDSVDDAGWHTPKVATPVDMSPWERDRMVLIVEDAASNNVLVNLESVKTSMMARLSLEDAIALRKELNKAISAVRKELK